MEHAPSSRKTRRAVIVRAALLVLLAVTALAGLALDPEAAYQQVHAQRFVLKGWVSHNYELAVAAYLAIYFLGVMLSLPGAIWLTIMGGFMFGTVQATAYTAVAATAGATAVFLAARFIVGDALRRRTGPFLARLETGFRCHAFNYLIVLRMLPIFPFWVVNLVPAAVGVPLRTYVLGTFIGIIPGSIAFAGLGAGLARVIDSEEALDTSLVLRPEILVPLAAMIVLALAPVAYARLRERKDADS